jgi:hypothetical protein
MPHANIPSRKPAVAAALILLLGCLGLAACGGSSSTTSTGANAASTGNASSTPSTNRTGTSAAPGAPGTGRFAALGKCLQKNGITLPKRTAGARPGGGFLPGSGAGNGPRLPGGATRAQYEAALKKCGGSGHFFGGGGARRFDSPVFKTALAKYGECLRQNGIKVPPPNTSGNGPIFDTKGIDTSSAQFRSASTKCRSALAGVFRHPAAGTPGPGPGGAPAAG